MVGEIGASGGSAGMVVVAASGGIDPSNLHLKKELTQIRKAARVLRDPGTSSSWQSPLTTAASLTKHHYVHHQKHGRRESMDGNGSISTLEQISQPRIQVDGSDSIRNDEGNVNAVLKEKRVFLYNWKSQKSEGEVSRQICEDEAENSKNMGSSFYREESVGVDLNHGRNGGGNDSRSDSCSSDKCASAIFRCKDTRFSPSIKRSLKKKSKRNNCSIANLRNHNEKKQKHVPMRGVTKNVVQGPPGLSLGRCNEMSLVDQSDDTVDFCNSEDLRRGSAVSPLLEKLKSNGWVHPPTKFLRSRRKDTDSISCSTTALSASSCNKHDITNPTLVESWDATTESVNDIDDVGDDQLDFPGGRRCGIPCYWSRRSTPNSRMAYGTYSPSFSDTLRKGTSMFCGSRTVHQRRRQRSALGSNKKKLSGAQSPVPLLTNSGDVDGASSTGSGISGDEFSTNFGELDREALSRLDGRRWSSSCRSQEGLDLVALNGEVHGESSPENVASLTHKYRPMFFEELVGQNIVVQSLTTAISRGRIAPVYLFQGPRGTGKTSTARIFAAALNCLVHGETKPCGVCKECSDFISGKSKYLKEVNGSNKKGIEKIKDIVKNVGAIRPSARSGYEVLIIDECQLLPSKTWLSFLRFLEKPHPHILFILMTTDIDNIPRTILSRCHKHIFSKISSGDIVARLKKIASDENLDVALDALDLIALNADGSLRDAETMLDQLSLFGKRISIPLVNELIGVVSDEKLLELLELAMSSNATETVIRARELMDSGVDPITLMSQMATLIVDIIAGTYPSVDAVSEREVNRLKHALSILSEAEKHLRLSSERSTWFTATLLQLGSMPSPVQTHFASSRRQSCKSTEEDRIHMLSAAHKQRAHSLLGPEKPSSSSFMNAAALCKSSSQANAASPTRAATFESNDSDHCLDDFTSGRSSLRDMNSKMLMAIWLQCIEKCHSKMLQQLLRSYGKLVSLSEVKGGYVAWIAFGEPNVKTRAEGFLSTITNSFETVLRRNVEVKVILLPVSSSQNLADVNAAKFVESNMTVDHSNLELSHDTIKVARGSFNVPEGNQKTPFESVAGNVNMSISKECSSNIPGKRIESIINEHRLETAWLQAMEKGTPGSMNRLKPERNQILPQDGTYNPNDVRSMNREDVPLKHWEDELNHEIKALKIKDEMQLQREHNVKKMDHCPISPSLLHNGFARDFDRDNMGYDSGPGAGGCNALCWNNSKPQKRGKVIKPVRARRNEHFSWFGECGKSRTADN